MNQPTPHPSTEWVETIDPAEQARQAKFAEVIVGIQQRVDRKHGPGRAFHRHQVLGLSGELEVHDDLPAWTRHGLFAAPGTYPVLIRLSNGGIVPARDAVPDIRGFALSVREVDGPSALGGRTDRQDFLLINRPTFGFRDSSDFAPIVEASVGGQTQLLKTLVAEKGKVGGAKEAARLTKDLLRNFSGFATERFYSAAPIACGQYAAKIRLVPLQGGKRLTARLDLAGDIAGRLAKGPLEFDLQLQPYIDEDVTPIEDGSVEWREADSPFVTVARLTVAAQDPHSTQGEDLAEQIEADKFDPWAALEDHRPLGEIMRARKAAYYPSQQQRHASDS